MVDLCLGIDDGTSDRMHSFRCEDLTTVLQPKDGVSNGAEALEGLKTFSVEEEEKYNKRI